MTLTADEIAEIEKLERDATPGPWRAGRSDMVSYTGDGEGPFKNVYCDDERGGMHLGERLPYTVARGEGDECTENALLIATLRNHAKELLAAARYAERFRLALESIAEHPHCTGQRGSALEESDGMYAIGVTDGHRCAANIAREALR